MTSELRTTTLSGNAVAEHSCDGFDCYPCLQADQEAASQRLTLGQKAKKFRAPRTRKSATLAARPVALQNITHVAGDVPAPLQQALVDKSGEKFVAEPTRLSSATIIKGFLLAGNAYFTVRSLKTGTRYTYRVNRADCSRCGKKDCHCWAHPNYFVSLLTGPDNTGDYTYLGMLRDNAFRATRATGAQATGKPFLAFAYIWKALAAGQAPAQVEVWHEGRCGRCGRMLTVPESIAAGIGPECAAKGGM